MPNRGLAAAISLAQDFKAVIAPQRLRFHCEQTSALWYSRFFLTVQYPGRQGIHPKTHWLP
jgi:hypothetical protein